MSGPKSTEERVEELVQLVISMASLDFAARATVGTSGGALDALALGLNMLAEELEHSVTARAELSTLNERLALALAVSRQGVWDWDLARDEAHLSAEYWRMLGYAEGEVRTDLAFFQSLVHPDDAPTVGKTMQEHFGGKSERSVIEYRMRTKSGDYRWIHEVGRVTARSPDGAPLRMIGVVMDIDDRKRSELERAKLQREVAHKNESLGRMAGAVAHSFNSTLGTLLGLLELARDSVGQPAECVATLDEATAEVERAAELGRALRRYAGGGAAQAGDFELGTLCREATALMETLLPEGVRLAMTVPPEGIVVHADAHLVRDALTQLVTNAGEAMAGREGEVAVQVGVVPSDGFSAGRTWPAGWSAAGRTWAYLAVRDEGGGIAPADLDRIFDPFFSTKFLGRGLGLALVLSTVSSFGGAVSVETGPAGSTFRVLLPVTVSPEAPR